MAFNKYPYTDFHEMNLDFILEKVRNIDDAVEESKTSAINAKTSEDAAKASENAAKASEDSAKASEESATASAGAAADIVADTNNQIAVLQARVDNIIPEGTQTEGNTELLDIRVGAEGVIYDSAGNAVRKQIVNLDNKLSTALTDINVSYYNKNVLKNTLDNTSRNGVTVTKNDDGSYTLTGTATTDTWFFLDTVNTANIFRIGDGLSLSGGNNDANVVLYKRLHDDNQSYGWVENTSGISNFIVDENMHFYQLAITVWRGKTVNTIVKPSLSLSGIQNVQDQIDKSQTIRVCAFNVGNFAMGKKGYGEGTPEMHNNFVDTFIKSDADIYLFSEWDEYWNKEDDILSVNEFSGFKAYHGEKLDVTEGRFVAQMAYTDYPIVQETMTYYADGESRHFIDYVILVGSKQVHFISTHLPYSSKALRHEDMDKLWQYINNNNIEYYVIGGDFNLGLGGDAGKSILQTAREDIEKIESFGAISVQGGFWGDAENDNFINTYNEGSLFQPLDNIVVSNNIAISKAYVVQSDASDHYAIIADVKIK